MRLIQRGGPVPEDPEQAVIRFGGMSSEEIEQNIKTFIATYAVRIVTMTAYMTQMGGVIVLVVFEEEKPGRHYD